MSTTLVTATSAIKLTEKQMDSIKKTVAQKFPKTKVEITNVVDGSIIGGVKLTINAVEYDATVTGKLERLRNHLLQQI